MYHPITRCGSFLGLLLLPAMADGAEKVESPLYKSWASFKQGTTVAYKSVTESPGGKAESRITYKLVERTDDKVVIELQVTTHQGGKEVKGSPQRLENGRYFRLPAGVKKEDFGKPVGVLKQGEETLTLGKVKYKTSWYTAKTRVEAGDMMTQTWSSPTVPGGLVKSVSKVAATGATTTMELLEVKKP